MPNINGARSTGRERGCNSTLRISEDGVRVWTTTTTIVCTASRHDTISAYKNHHCRCPEATRRAVAYERRREAGLVLPQQPADLTMRRLRALAVLGWPGDEIARRVGRNPVSVTQIRRGAHDMVTGATCAAVYKVYRQLHDQPGPSQRARAHAARQGWVRPSLLLLYGDVDEVTVARAIHGEPVDLKRNERLVATQLLHRAGRTYSEIARRLRVTPRQVYRDLGDLGLTVERAARTLDFEETG